ncbi:MAG TPA: M42 family peptidase [Solirubrobacterales bacterium]|nr:M42 family peptidase [Solirubrobacterales bacterium]
MSIPKLLEELLLADGPSGFEGPASDVWRRFAADFGAEVSADKIGSSIARVGESGPLLALVGHIDEIGLIVRHIDEEGMLWFAQVGIWKPHVLVGQRVKIRGREGLVDGVVAGRSEMLSSSPEGPDNKAVRLADLHIDVGASSLAEAAEAVSVGNPVVPVGDPLTLRGNRLISKALDNRVGSYVALEATRRIATAGGAPSIAAVVTVQEEVGIVGAATAAYEVRPDIAIAIDVCHASDVPDVDPKETGARGLGSGPVVQYAPTLFPKLAELMIETAAEEGIPCALGANGFAERGISSGTDADVIQASRSGVVAGLVSIPVRYMHTPVEMVDLDDVEAAVRLLVAVASKLGDDLELGK